MELPGGLVGRIHQRHALPHDAAQGGTNQGIVGAAQDQGVDIDVDQLGQIPAGDLIGHRIYQQPFLHQRDEERAGLAVDGHVPVQLLYVLGVDLAADGGLRGDDAYPSISCGLSGSFRPRLHHPDDGDIDVPLQGLHGIGAGSVAGHHDGLHPEGA